MSNKNNFNINYNCIDEKNEKMFDINIDSYDTDIKGNFSISRNFIEKISNKFKNWMHERQKISKKDEYLKLPE